jgi:putative endonuclease
MSDPRHVLGSWGEEQASRFLRSQGYEIVERNWRCAAGELDIVAWEGANLVFVEVRTRRSQTYGTPEESVTPAKQTKLVELAQTYLQEHAELDCIWRIDVVAVEVMGGQPQIRVIRHAVMG